MKNEDGGGVFRLGIFTLRFDPKRRGFDDEEVARFCAEREVTEICAHFFTVAGRPYWTVGIHYRLRSEGRADAARPGAAERLPAMSEAHQLRFQQLRAWRNERAKQEGIPPFIIFTNRQLRDLAGLAKPSLKRMEEIRGIGEGKTTKYGGEVLGLLREGEPL